MITNLALPTRLFIPAAKYGKTTSLIGRKSGSEALRILGEPKCSCEVESEHHLLDFTSLAAIKRKPEFRTTVSVLPSVLSGSRWTKSHCFICYFTSLPFFFWCLFVNFYLLLVIMSLAISSHVNWGKVYLSESILIT